MATFDTKQYIEQLAQTAGLSQEEKDNILKVAANEKFSKALADDVLRQADYSRSMDALKADKDKWTKFYSENLTWKQNNERVLSDYETRLAAYEAQYGQINNNQTIQTVNQDFLTRKDFEAEWAKRSAQSDAAHISLTKAMGRLASQHVLEFKEALDTDALEKVCVDKNLPLQQAYEEMVGPRRAEYRSVAHKAEIAKAVEEGVRDFASKNKIPVDSKGRESYHVMFDRDPSKQVGVQDYVPNSGQLSNTATRQLRDNFVEAWNSAPASETSGT